ncbi:MAG: hypothetical protein GEU95_17645 [Rhizobiales bacterium]|nr:hypothetical protein [Hyphomicrobiales bacterium]
MTRDRLPNRRHAETFTFEHDGVRYVCTVGRFPDGRLGEIFIDGSKVGSAVGLHAQDAAVLASLLLQHGVHASTIRHSIAGPIATALAMVVR